jgi:hypothetical protein
MKRVISGILAMLIVLPALEITSGEARGSAG